MAVPTVHLSRPEVGSNGTTFGKLDIIACLNQFQWAMRNYETFSNINEGLFSSGSANVNIAQNLCKLRFKQGKGMKNFTAKEHIEKGAIVW